MPGDGDELVRRPGPTSGRGSPPEGPTGLRRPRLRIQLGLQSVPSTRRVSHKMGAGAAVPERSPLPGYAYQTERERRRGRVARGLQRDGAGVVAPSAALRRDAAAAHRHEAARSPGEEERGPTASEKEVRVSGPARGGAAAPQELVAPRSRGRDRRRGGAESLNTRKNWSPREVAAAIADEVGRNNI